MFEKAEVRRVSWGATLALAYAQAHPLVTHYWAHDGFLTPPILDRIDRLWGIPATLIHGRRDVSGPAVVAWRLHRAWADSELIVVEADGHGGEAMVQALCSANSQHADRFDAEPA